MLVVAQGVSASKKEPMENQTEKKMDTDMKSSCIHGSIIRIGCRIWVEDFYSLGLGFRV